jgi:hypothetical protein
VNFKHEQCSLNLVMCGGVNQIHSVREFGVRHPKSPFEQGGATLSLLESAVCSVLAIQVSPDSQGKNSSLFKSQAGNFPANDRRSSQLMSISPGRSSPRFSIIAIQISVRSRAQARLSFTQERFVRLDVSLVHIHIKSRETTFSCSPKAAAYSSA